MAKTEVRFEIDSGDLAVIDGYCSGTGKCRTEVINFILSEWSSNQLHISTLVCRVAGVNPMVTEKRRSGDK